MDEKIDLTKENYDIPDPVTIPGGTRPAEQGSPSRIDISNDFCDGLPSPALAAGDADRPVTVGTCPYCQAPIKPGIPLKVCPACEMPHHAECWDENNGCTTYGCNQQQAARQARPAHSRPPVGTAYAPPPPDQNTSGQGSTAVVPEAIKRWNWGAFWLCFIWAACNNVWIGLLALIPYLNLVMSIVLGVKGNELAWQNKKWESVEHFQRVQANWAKAGWIVIVSGVLIGLMLVS